MAKVATADNDHPSDDTSVFEVVVRNALAGAPWREIFAGVMEFNNFTPAEVEQEVQRRQAALRKPKSPPR